MDKDIWNGYITDIDDNEITCILRRDYNLDKELVVGRGLLTKEQDEMASLGLVMRFDIISEKLEFMKEDESWC